MELELHQLELKYERLRAVDDVRQGMLQARLRTEGQQSPVLVVSAGAGRWVLIEGYRRVRALRELGRDSVQAQVLEMEEQEALLFCHRQQRPITRTALEEGWLLRELVQEFGLSMGELALKLERSKSWVSRRLALVRELPEEVQELVRQGAVGSWTAERILAPLARANKGDCLRLAQGIAGKRLSTRQVELLYAAWRQGGPQERKQLVENPLLVLRALEELSQTPAVEPAREGTCDSLLRDLEAVCGICQRARRRLRQGAQELNHPLFQHQLRQGFEQCRLAFQSLREQAEESLYAGYADAHSGITVAG